jgi:hypothetical protein
LNGKKNEQIWNLLIWWLHRHTDDDDDHLINPLPYPTDHTPKTTQIHSRCIHFSIFSLSFNFVVRCFCPIDFGPSFFSLICCRPSRSTRVSSLGADNDGGFRRKTKSKKRSSN